MGYEPAYVDDWISQTLLNDARLIALAGRRVYDTLPDAAAVMPWITYSPVSVIDTNGVGEGNRILVRTLYDVRVVGLRGDAADTLRAIANRIDLLLQGKHAAFPWGYILGTIRTASFERQFTRQAIAAVQIVQTYRIDAQVSLATA